MAVPRVQGPAASGSIFDRVAFQVNILDPTNTRSNDVMEKNPGCYLSPYHEREWEGEIAIETSPVAV